MPASSPPATDLRLRHRAIVGAGDGDRDGLGRGDVAVGYFVGEGLDSALAVIESLSRLGDIEAVGAVGVDASGCRTGRLTIALQREREVIAIDIGCRQVARQRAGVFATGHGLGFGHRDRRWSP